MPRDKWQIDRTIVTSNSSSAQPLDIMMKQQGGAHLATAYTHPSHTLLLWGLGVTEVQYGKDFPEHPVLFPRQCSIVTPISLWYLEGNKKSFLFATQCKSTQCQSKLVEKSIGQSRKACILVWNWRSLTRVFRAEFKERFHVLDVDSCWKCHRGSLRRWDHWQIHAFKWINRIHLKKQVLVLAAVYTCIWLWGLSESLGLGV